MVVEAGTGLIGAHDSTRIGEEVELPWRKKRWRMSEVLGGGSRAAVPFVMKEKRVRLDVEDAVEAADDDVAVVVALGTRKKPSPTRTSLEAVAGDDDAGRAEIVAADDDVVVAAWSPRQPRRRPLETPFEPSLRWLPWEASGKCFE